MCADDYGLDDISSMHIQECIDRGALHRVSVFPNFDKVDLNRICNSRQIQLSLHLNLVEGKCMANADEIDLIADQDGRLKHNFTALLKISLMHRREFEEQIYKEIQAQVLFWKDNLPKDMPFSLDSHQHTHMIPAIFRALLRVLHDENIEIRYMRVPAEPLLPYLCAPSLYFTYKPINLIKQWLLKFLWLINYPRAKKAGIPFSYFCGILFSGKMDEKRVRKILPKYIELAKKRKKNIEVLFHPGYRDADQSGVNAENVAFSYFYLSQNRRTEFDSVISFSERSVM